MSTRVNWPLWSGLFLSPIAFLSYPFVFERWPVTRDFPWVNLLLFVLTAVLLGTGLRRAFAPGRLRSLRITAGLIATTLSVAIFANFVMSVFVHARHLPASAHAPRVGERAPDFTLPDESGAPVSLAALLSPTPVSGAPASSLASRGVLLVFSMYAGCRACNSEYRGIQQHIADFSAMGVRPVVISIDPPDVSHALSREAGYTFTFLSDPSLAVIRRYDVANGETARPAEFLLDSTGIVRWRNLTTNMFVRARPEHMLQAIATIQ
jgi:mycoredoxin-dependent peroxiredoxin